MDSVAIRVVNANEIPKLYKQLNPVQKLAVLFKLYGFSLWPTSREHELTKPPGPKQINVYIHRIRG